MAYGNGNKSGWALGVPIFAVLAFGVRLLALCGRSSSSSYSPPYNYNPPSLPQNIDYGALLGLDAGSGSRGGSGETDPDVLAFDATNVYVADAKDHLIYAFPKVGGARKTLTRTTGAVHGLAVGATDVYFTTRTPIGALNLGALMSVPTRGGIAVSVVGAGLYVPERVITDARSIYFTGISDDSNKAASAGLFRVAAGVGNAPQNLDVDPNAPDPWAAVVDDTNVYFTTAEGTEIDVVPKGGGETKKLVGDQLLARDLVADADAIFWTDGLAGKVMKVAKRGGTPVPLATGETNVDGIAVDSTYVYWVSHASGAKLATIMRAPKSGGLARPIAQGLAGVRNIVSDGTRTYWSYRGSVFWVGANDAVASAGGATIHTLGSGGATASGSPLDAGIASRGAYGTGTGSLGGSSGPSVIRTFRSKDR